MTHTFYESGYNAQAWTISSQPSTDIFYFDLTPLPNCEDLIAELRTSALDVFKSNSILLDDGSLEAEILKLLAPPKCKLHIKTWPLDFPMDLEKSIQWSNLRLDDPELHLLLQYAKYIGRPLIVPRAFLRVINANWSHSTNKSYGDPYWVYTENERYHCMHMIQQAEQLEIEPNIFKWSSRVYSAYFNNPMLKAFFLSTDKPAANNYLLERSILCHIYEELGGKAQVELHKKHWPAPKALRAILPTVDLQQASFPIHGFYKKYLNQNLPANTLELAIYGPTL